MALSNSVPQTFPPGQALQDGSALNSALANPKVSTTYNQTATGTTQLTAVPISSQVTQFSTVAANTGGQLQCNTPGASQEVYNDGANTLKVYPPAGMVIDAVAADGAVSLSAAARCRYTCMAPGYIISALLGATSA